MPHNSSRSAVEMFVRFAFSCLTDADGLDTERHKNRQQSDLRGARRNEVPTIIELRDALYANQRELPSGNGKVNRVRRVVFRDCVDAALKDPGVYSLTVPTGGGKTRSALGFALTHAAEHGLRRVVYAAPFTSILDQTASEYEKIFGKNSRIVLEHHSAVEPRNAIESEDGDEDHELWRRLASENWDAPLIVTTQVQLFESLFSNRPGKCRKLHRLSSSVIILDEVQTLPFKLLRPLVDGLQLLASNFGVTVVLCTATQPSLDTQTFFYQGFSPAPVEIVKSPKDHFSALKRVHFRVDFTPRSWDNVKIEMLKSKSCLCVVNTRRQAIDLLNLLDPKRNNNTVFHLSTLMCGRHRRATLEIVRQRLKDKLPTLLVSTTVVEAGVDVDFPRMMRAFAPLPSVIQAAGRCNREGKRRWQRSVATIFVPEEDLIPSDSVYKAARSLTQRRIETASAAGREYDFHDPDVVREWFGTLIHDMGNQIDAAGVLNDIKNFRFEVVADKVKLIPEDTVPVLPLAYANEEAQAIIDEAERIGHLTRDLWRRLQPLCVSVYPKFAEGLEHPSIPDLYVWYGEYDSKTGMPLRSDPTQGVVMPFGMLFAP